MKKPLCNKTLASLALAIACASPVAQALEPSTTPDTVQQALIDRGYGMFIHFGMNTFIEAEWSDGTAPASAYCPTELNPAQWVDVARRAGFRYVILTVKHHDGFCLWDSKVTDYDVASSPIKTDVVKAVADACKEAGLQFGIYYSLWDRHEPSYSEADFSGYINFMEAQLTELMTGYGEICELWLDGGWDKPAEMWELPRLNATVKRMQPQCAFGVNNAVMTAPGKDKGGFDNMASPDDMIDGRDLYLRYFPTDFRLADPKLAHRDDRKLYTHEGHTYYLPFEHTICLSKRWTWFQKSFPGEVRSEDELDELFYWCTANDNALVVNIPPDRRGLIRENEANAVISLAHRLGIKHGKPLPSNGRFIAPISIQASSTWNSHPDYTPDKAIDGGMISRWASHELTPILELTLDPDEMFNKIAIFEYLDETRAADNFTSIRTNRIKRYSISLHRAGKWETIFASDEPIGDCKVIRFPERYSGEKLRLTVHEATDFPSIRELHLISVTD